MFFRARPAQQTRPGTAKTLEHLAMDEMSARILLLFAESAESAVNSCVTSQICRICHVTQR